jgi:hypothetical protein
MYNVDVCSLLQQQQQRSWLAPAADSTSATAAAAAAAAALMPQQHMRVVSHLRLPGPPAKLQLLPDSCCSSSTAWGSFKEQQQQGMQESLQKSLHVLAVSEGLWLLQISQQSHQMKLRHIAAAPAVLATALSLPQHALRSSSSSSSDDAGQQQQQQHIACVLPTGQLQLICLPHLQQHQQHRIQTWLPGVAVHQLLPYPGPQQQLLLAQCSGSYPLHLRIAPAHMQQQQQGRQRDLTWLQCLDAATGALLAAYQPSGGQIIACTGLWDAAAASFSNCTLPRSAASSSPEQQQQQQGLPGQHSSAPSSNKPAAAAAGAAGAAGTGAVTDPALQLATLLRGLDSPGGSAARFRSQQVAAGSGQTWSNLKRAGPLVVLGTRASQPEDGCKGQVVVLQLLSQHHTASAAAAAAGVAASSSSSRFSYSFQRAARLRMPEPVTAVCGYSQELLLVAVGNVLAAYRTPPEQQQQQQRGQLQQAAYCFVRAPIVSLSVAEATSGLVLAADMLQGITAYQIEVNSGTGQVTMHAVAAHDDVRPCAQVACLPPLPGLSNGSAAAAATAAAAKNRTGSSSSSRGVASHDVSDLQVDRAAAVAAAHGLCQDSRGYVLEVSWAKQRVVPVKCLQTLACIPLDGSAASMQVLPAAGGTGSSSSSSCAADWFCRSLYALLDNEDIQLHWQNPLAAAAAASAGAACSNAADSPHAGAAAAAAGSAAAAAGVAASSAVVASRSGAVLHLQKLPAQEGRLLLHLQQLLLQHPLTRGLCIGAEHVLHEQQQQQLAGNGAAVNFPARLGAVDARVLQQLLLLPGELQQLLLHSAGLGQCLPGRLARALRVPELQQAVFNAVLCRLQVLPCWE